MKHDDPFYDRETTVSATECTGLVPAGIDTEEEAESYLADHTLGWKYAFATDNVVIYGNNSAINDLDL